MKVARISPLQAIVNRWYKEADGYEKLAEQSGPYTAAERNTFREHARIKRACAKELQNEIMTVRRG